MSFGDGCKLPLSNCVTWRHFGWSCRKTESCGCLMPSAVRGLCGTAAAGCGSDALKAVELPGGSLQRRKIPLIARWRFKNLVVIVVVWRVCFALTAEASNRMGKGRWGRQLTLPGHRPSLRGQRSHGGQLSRDGDRDLEIINQLRLVSVTKLLKRCRSGGFFFSEQVFLVYIYIYFIFFLVVGNR